MSKPKIGIMGKAKLVPSDKIYVAESSGKGRGVFASKDINKGTFIEVAPCIVLPVEDTDMAFGTKLADYCFGSSVDDSLTVIGLGCSSLYNHSSKPNAEFTVAATTISIKALKNIKKDQEILVDYGWDSWHLLSMGIK